MILQKISYSARNVGDLIRTCSFLVGYQKSCLCLALCLPYFLRRDKASIYARLCDYSKERVEDASSLARRYYCHVTCA